MNVTAVRNAPTAPDWNRVITDSSVSGDAFLVLLAAQLQHQDPLDPMTGEAMLSQIAQLTSVSQLTLLNKNFEAMATAQRATDMAVLVGREVQWADTVTNDINSGIVTRVQLGASGWEVCIGDTAVSVHDVIAVQ